MTKDFGLILEEIIGYHSIDIFLSIEVIENG
jgi:hypothetical protein